MQTWRSEAATAWEDKGVASVGLPPRTDTLCAALLVRRRDLQEHRVVSFAGLVEGFVADKAPKRVLQGCISADTFRVSGEELAAAVAEKLVNPDLNLETWREVVL